MVDPAVEADLLRPITGMKGIAAIDAAPIGRRPQQPTLRRLHPRPRHPKVVGDRFAPRPESGYPQIAFRGDRWLLIGGKRWRRDVDLARRVSPARLKMRRQRQVSAGRKIRFGHVAGVLCEGARSARQGQKYQTGDQLSHATSDRCSTPPFLSTLTQTRSEKLVGSDRSIDRVINKATRGKSHILEPYPRNRS
ncbi:hypothetical protein GALL_540670 [mine drainage metagenome]|uniref:Uncharacterized protein n=1 Tax=mine drainage metagenome TaxID=410659 RepID=A0A1J5P9A0_9ZZZZ